VPCQGPVRAPSSEVVRLRCSRSTHHRPARHPRQAYRLRKAEQSRCPVEQWVDRIRLRCAILRNVQPSRYRIPGNQDAAAEAILDRAPEQIDPRFPNSLDRNAWQWLGRYGARQVTVALRQCSADLLHRALLATAIAACLHNDDDRDVMVGLALPWVVAQQLGLDPTEVFGKAARRITNPAVAELLTVFGARQDITLKAFGWQQVTTDHGPDFRHA
jgi:hypothetical protein